jgi:hypothetical protein
VFETRNLDALEVNPQREVQERDDDVTDHWAFGFWSLVLVPPAFKDPKPQTKDLRREDAQNPRMMQ